VELDYEVDEKCESKLEMYPPFIFDVYDYDSGLMDSTDDFLGRAIIKPKNA